MADVLPRAPVAPARPSEARRPQPKGPLRTAGAPSGNGAHQQDQLWEVLRGAPHPAAEKEAVEPVKEFQRDPEAIGAILRPVPVVGTVPKGGSWLPGDVDSGQHVGVVRRWDNVEWEEKQSKEAARWERDVLAGQLHHLQHKQRQDASLGAKYLRLELQLNTLQAAFNNVMEHAQHQAIQEARAASRELQAFVVALRADLEREVKARSALAENAAEWAQQLRTLVAQLGLRQEKEAHENGVQLALEASQRRAQVKALGPELEALRGDLAGLRKNMQDAEDKLARRCVEIEGNLEQRVKVAQDAAQGAFREFQGNQPDLTMQYQELVASLRQLKATSCAQQSSEQAQALENLLQKNQLDLDMRLQDIQDAIHKRHAALEQALAREQGLQAELQQNAQASVSRVEEALERAKASWQQTFEALAAEASEAKHQLQQAIGPTHKDLEQRLAQLNETIHHRLKELEASITSADQRACALEDHLASHAKELEARLMESESRVGQRFLDQEAAQESRMMQNQAEALSTLKSGLAAQLDSVCSSLVQVEQGVKADCTTLRATVERKTGEIDRQVMTLQQDLNARIAASEATLDALNAHVCKEQKEVWKNISTSIEAEREHAEQLFRDAKATCADATEDLQDEFTQKVDVLSQTCQDLACEAEILKQHLLKCMSGDVQKLETKFGERLTAEYAKLQDEARQMVEDERKMRLKSETQRLEALQKRFNTHEELSTGKIQTSY